MIALSKHTPIVLGILMVALCLSGCAKNIQPAIYGALVKEISLPEKEDEKAALFAHLKSVAHLDEKCSILGYRIEPFVLRRGEKGFYDSAIFIRSVHFNSLNEGEFLLREEIYSNMEINHMPYVLRRTVYDLSTKGIILDETVDSLTLRKTP